MWVAPRPNQDASSSQSTSGLLAILDLNQIMEDMDIDQVMDVPDTPDRSAERNIDGRKCDKHDSSSLASAHSGNSKDKGVLNQLRGRGRLVTENGHSRRLHFRSRESSANSGETECCSKSMVSQLENSSAPKSAHLFRRMRSDGISKHEAKHSIGPQHTNKGKAFCNGFPSKSSACQNDNKFLDLIGPNGAFKDLLDEEIGKGSMATNGCSSLHCIENSPKPSCNTWKGKEKTDNGACDGSGSGIGFREAFDISIDIQPRSEKHVSSSLQYITSPRVSGQKRLVRNGCISPHNIIARAKQLAEQQSSSSKDVEQNDAKDILSRASPSRMDIKDPIAEINNSSRVKGKSIISHPCTSKQHDFGTVTRSPIVHNEQANDNSDTGRDAFGCFEGLSGWRSTRNRSKKVDVLLSDGGGHLPRRNNAVQCSLDQKNDNGVEKKGDPEVQAMSLQHGPAPSGAQTASNLMSGSNQVNVRQRARSILIKRQRKHGSATSNTGESSTSVFNDSEIMFLGSSGEPSNSGSTRSQSHHGQGVMEPVIEIDEQSPEIRHVASRNGGSMNNDDSDARARQIEADEILARELQEQLYHEMPVDGGVGIDAHIAQMLQQQEQVQPTSSSRNHRVPRASGPAISRLYRQSQSRSSQNPSIRRGTQARGPTSTRMAQLRSRFPNQSHAIPSGERNLHFPLNMDLDMRIDILEALEAAVGDFGDMRMPGHILQIQRDFNENDYEMLLALDENNHNVGASVNQMNSLPQSTVQTDNFEESCAICLETPTIGDTIRHLPCLHKFHKDCIDPWLARSTSCPVCKSSIT